MWDDASGEGIVPLIEILRRLVERQRHRKERLAAAHRLGRDDGAWAELFRRDEWAPLPAGHLGRCGRCGASLDLASHHCPNCGAEWGGNARRGDLTRQILVVGGATALSVLLGYGSTAEVRSLFEGKDANPEMVETLASFSWLFFGVVSMIALTYAIERFNLAPVGHWRKKRDPGPASGNRRKSNELA
jgi:hypothetical protein